MFRMHGKARRTGTSHACGAPVCPSPYHLRMSQPSPSTQSADAASSASQHKLAADLAALELVLAGTPDDAAALIQLAGLRFQAGQFRASVPPLLRAARHLPRNAPLIVALVQHLIACGEVVAARACLALLASAPDAPAELLATQAHLRFTLGEIPPALDLMERAIRAGADTPDVHHMHAMLLQFSGRFDDAARVLEACLGRWPGFGDAAMVLANLHRQTPAANRLPALREQLQRLPADAHDPDRAFVRAEFEYACFKTLDDLDRPQEAWPALARCNALMHQLNPYDAAGEAAVVDALTAAPPAAAAPATQPDGPCPIFIVGMPRSGTTLLDRILSSHPQVESAGEIIDFWRQLHWAADVTPDKTRSLLRIIGRSADIDYRELGARYLRQTQWRAHGKRWYVDKLPANIQMVAFIRRALPHAPILHMVREPMDTCFSNYKAMFGNISSYSYDFAALAHYYRGYRALVRHWHRTLPGAMLDVNYAALVGDTAATVAAILDHCGLPPDDACLHPDRNPQPVATPSSAQVRAPINARGIGQWRRYAQELAPLQAALENAG